MGAISNPSKHELWAVTTYFNPIGYRRRRENYRVFRERCPIPLVAVELAYQPQFELTDGDAEILVQIRGGDVLWQKERLLNLALDALPDACRKIAWIDCDLVFGAADWPERVVLALDRHPLVQAFGRVHYLSRDQTPAADSATGAMHMRHSLASGPAAGISAADCLDETLGGPHLLPSATGFVWAARRQLIESCRFFDECVVGAGDRAMAAAWYGCFDHAIRRMCMHEVAQQRYLGWARRAFDAVRGQVANIDIDIFHLWHGNLDNRRSYERHVGFSGYGFDPSRDVALDTGGSWRWNSDKPDMHRYVRNYFAARREDG